jgi:hypothetical protein
LREENEKAGRSCTQEDPAHRLESVTVVGDAPSLPSGSGRKEKTEKERHRKIRKLPRKKFRP